MTATVGERWTHAKFASAIGQSERAAAALAREHDAPRDARGWIFPDCLLWHDRRRAAAAKAKEKPDDVKDAHRRQAIADARLAEIRVERELGELVPRERFRTALRDAFHRVAARLRNLPPRLAGVAVGVKSTTEALARFEPLVDELFTELYAGDDVPMHEDE